MKIPASFLAFTILLAAMMPARADYEIRRTIESPMRNTKEDTVCKVKGTRCRMDFDNGRYLVVDPKEGTYFMVDLKTKNVVDFGNVARPIANTLPNKFDGSAPKPEATGRKDKIDGYDVEEYVCGLGMGMKGAFWVAPNYPKEKAAALKEEQQRVADSSATSSKVPLPDLESLPGPALRIVTFDPNDKVLSVSTVKSVSVEPIDERQFQIPAGFTVKKIPKGKVPQQE
jgi:hypothetical protein